MRDVPFLIFIYIYETITYQMTHKLYLNGKLEYQNQKLKTLKPKIKISILPIK